MDISGSVTLIICESDIQKTQRIPTYLRCWKVQPLYWQEQLRAITYGRICREQCTNSKVRNLAVQGGYADPLTSGGMMWYCFLYRISEVLNSFDNNSAACNCKAISPAFVAFVLQATKAGRSGLGTRLVESTLSMSWSIVWLSCTLYHDWYAVAALVFNRMSVQLAT